MLSRLWALSLIVLILSPVSAPFVACDFAAIFPHTAPHAAPLRATPTQVTLVRETVRAAASPLLRLPGRSGFAMAEVHAPVRAAIHKGTAAERHPVALGLASARFVSPLRI